MKIYRFPRNLEISLKSKDFQRNRTFWPGIRRIPRILDLLAWNSENSCLEHTSRTLPREAQRNLLIKAPSGHRIWRCIYKLINF